ncbi:hypothetical protein NPX13_g8307 [Xylaria arbuscula]|uniref:RING-type domain-containing protein n=1 Tax=Xylaria arbuscula TaxID=114810 RepID=A0A9W8N8E8_9PEZI|nr:hypothetical protein NPX13_g8307 [Xylaria arbuscula]
MSGLDITMERRTVADVFAPAWEPYLNEQGHFQEDVDFTLECYICRKGLAINKNVDDNHETATMLPCGHVFGHECIKEWFQNSATCPACRKDWRHQGCCHPLEPKAIQAGPNFTFQELPARMEPEGLPQNCDTCRTTPRMLNCLGYNHLRNIYGPAPNPANPVQRRLFALQQYDNLQQHLQQHEDALSQTMGHNAARDLMQMVDDLRPHVDPEMRTALNRNYDDHTAIPGSTLSARGFSYNPRGTRPSPHDLVAAQWAPQVRPHWGRYHNMYGQTTRQQQDAQPQESLPAGPPGFFGPASNIHEHQRARYLETLEMEQHSPFRSTGNTTANPWQDFANAESEATLQDLYPEHRRDQEAEQLELYAQRRQRQRDREQTYALHPSVRGFRRHR